VSVNNVFVTESFIQEIRSKNADSSSNETSKAIKTASLYSFLLAWRIICVCVCFFFLYFCSCLSVL